MTNTPDHTFDLVIIGAGVAGGALAAAIAAAGGDSRILLVEQTRKSGSINRGDFLNPSHLELLDEWGALEQIRARGAEPCWYDEIYDNAGNLLLRHDLNWNEGKYPYGLCLEHPAIEDALLEAGAANPHLTIWRGARFEGLAGHDDQGVTLRISQDGRAVLVRAAWAVAADGRISRARQEAGIESVMHPYPYEILMLRTPTPSHWHQTSAQFSGPGGFAGLFVVNGEHHRIALVLPDGTAQAFLQLPEAERRAEVARRSVDLAGLPILWEHAHSYRLFWHHAPDYVKHRVILIGDAAHSFTPVLGMGMNLALEDARALAPLLSSRAGLTTLTEPEVQQRYEVVRRPRNQRVLKMSNQQGALFFEGRGLTHKLNAIGLRLLARFPRLQHPSFRLLFG